MDPYKISLVEVLDNNFRKLAIDCVVGSPQLLFTASTPMDRALFYIVHAVFRELLFFPAVIIVFTNPVCFWLGRVNGSDVVHDWPQNALAKSIVPVELKEKTT
jgi:hypothetical protein